MATPNTKATLKEYCLRKLVKPVIEINVDDDQVDDRLDEALEYFSEFHFDGVETKAATTNVNSIATQVNSAYYPNWTTTIANNDEVTFTARHSMDDGTVVVVTADMEIIQSSTGATAAVSAAALGVATESDIMVVPSVVTTMDLEYMLFHE